MQIEATLPQKMGITPLGLLDILVQGYETIESFQIGILQLFLTSVA